MFDAFYHFTEHISPGFTYLYEKYAVDDFALGPQANGVVPSPATVPTPSIMMLGYYWQPYKANTFCGRLSVATTTSFARWYSSKAVSVSSASFLSSSTSKMRPKIFICQSAPGDFRK
jgi:hypothetical protein